MKNIFIYTFLFYVIFQVAGFDAFTQSQGMNYVQVRDFRKPYATEPTTLSEDDAQTSIQYIDGLGRVIQTVGLKQSPSKKDVIAPVEYDAFGREVKMYLPYTVSGNGQFQPEALIRGDNITLGAIYDYYKTGSGTGVITDGASPKPYAETFFEESPLNRVLKQGASGNSFTGHEAQINYKVNLVNEVKRYDVTGTALYDFALSTSNSGFYAAGQLTVTESLDEDLRKVREYKDKNGRVVLKNVYNGVEILSTYYIYDEFSQLRAVLQPMYLDKTLAADVLNQKNWFAFLYVYDDRGRLVEKKVPGADVVYMVYDQWDRINYTQDGKQRVSLKWSFIRYDFLNRPIITGERVISVSSANITRAALQTLVSTITVHDEVKSTATGNSFGYSNNTGIIPPATTANANLTFAVNDVLTVSYYDDYTYSGFLTSMNFNNEMALSASDYVTLAGTATDLKTKRIGMMTGGITTTLGTTTRYKSVMYYDDKYRLIQSHRELFFGATSTERVSMKLDFLGKPTEDRISQATSNGNYQVKKKYTYDHVERLTQTTHQLIKNPGQVSTIINPEIVLNKLIYNEIGQVAGKNLHSADNGVNFIRNLGYNYNIRGWLKKCQGQNFRFDLFYEDFTTAGANTNGALTGNPIDGITYGNQYNGNISGFVWNNSAPYSWQYFYDGANRLTDAAGNYTYEGEGNIVYDKNGNILALNRNKARSIASVPPIDLLTYTFTGNQLFKVTDTAPAATKAGGFVDGANTTDDYAYDANGNLTQDLNKNILAGKITYNLLNLVNQVTIGSGATAKVISYKYDAQGGKRQTTVGTTNTTYEGIFEYDNTNMVSRIATDEGQLVLTWNGATYTTQYQYYLKDHLGNTMKVVEQGGTELQENHYYPFGLQINTNPTNPVTSYGINKYTYNGKEKQQETNWLDYGARMYNPEIARWMAVDPLSGISRRFSPYVYTNNNPLRFIDPDGMSISDVAEGIYTGSAAIEVFKKLQSETNGMNDEDKEDDKDKGKEMKKPLPTLEEAMARPRLNPNGDGIESDHTIEGFIIGTKALGKPLEFLFGRFARILGFGLKVDPIVAYGINGQGYTSKFLASLFQSSEGSGMRVLYRGMTGSESGSGALFLTEDAAYAATYAKNGLGVAEFKIPSYAYYFLKTEGLLLEKIGKNVITGTGGSEVMIQNQIVKELILRSIVK
jgi:RHS repeat-associated protein